MIEIFKALSEESRLRILSLLWDDELCVCEIEKILKLTQSNASRHLTALKNAGIITGSKQAQWIYYKINDKFKTENNDLYNYLQKILKEMPKYSEDKDEYRKCRNQNLCNK